MLRVKKRNASAKQVAANRRNAQNSTGPRTPQGKAHVALSALKHGLQAGPFVQGMLALHEDPRAYYRLLGDLLASLRPANPLQRMQVEDIARLRVEKQRLERARAALVVGKVRGPGAAAPPGLCRPRGEAACRSHRAAHARSAPRSR